MQPLLLFQLNLEFLKLAVVSRSQVIDEPGFVRLKSLASFSQLVPLLLGMRQVLPQHLVLLPKVRVAQLQLKFELLAVLRQLVDLLLLLGDLLVKAGLEVVALLLELLFEVV